MIRLARFFGVLSLVLAFFLSIGGLSPAPASPLLFDRGLPTANLNNATGVDRSNVAWAIGYYPTAAPSSYTVFGDDFSIGRLGSTYHLDKITVWTVDDSPSTSYRLLGGLPGAISQVSTSASVSKVTYVGGASYLGSSGTPYQIFQVDFSVNWTIKGGKLYQFFIDAPLEYYGTDILWATSFLHASNAARSGSPQEGADGKLLQLTLDSGMPGSVTSWDSNSPNAWNKSSDANVQIYGTLVLPVPLLHPVPLPPSLLLLGSGLAGLGLWRGRKLFKA